MVEFEGGDARGHWRLLRCIPFCLPMLAQGDGAFERSSPVDGEVTGTHEQSVGKQDAWYASRAEAAIAFGVGIR